MSTLATERQVAMAVVQGMADAAALLDADFRALSYNYAWSLLTGLKRRELEKRLAQGTPVFELLEGEGFPLREAARLALLEGREVRLDALPIRNAAQETVHVVASLIPLKDASSELIGVLQILRDITAEVRVQDKYKDMLALEKVRADQLEREVEARTVDLRAALEQVTVLSRTDPLTGLLNRRAFTELSEQAFKVAQRHQRQVAVILCDLDHFKKMNDSFGHQAGDTVLTQTAQALKKAVRASDSVARYGGEEFIILLTETHEQHVMEVAARCHERVREMALAELIPGMQRPQTVSVGVAIYPQHGENLDELTKNADKALYRAKTEGRDRVVLYQPGLPEVNAPTKTMPRVLLACHDSSQLAQWKHGLEPTFDVWTSEEVGRGLDAAVEHTVQVLIVDGSLGGGQGLGLMYSSMTALPHALRILVVDSVEQYQESRRASTLAVDKFVLRSEASSSLRKAIEDGIAERIRGLSARHSLPVVHVAEETQARLDKVIAEQRVSLVYQPMFDVKTRQLTAFEALARAQEPSLANPEVLFDVSVACGRIWRLSRVVRRKAAQALSAHPEDQHMLFVNLHPAELDDPQLLEDEALRQWAPRICFEITERAALPDFGHLRARLRTLRDAGYRFAVDDLGAGYASLNSLALLEPDFVKIDRLTVEAMVHSRPLRTLARRIVEFAEDAGIRVIGEGVERESELRVLQEVGCHWVQGYYVSHPRPDMQLPVPFFG